MKKIFAFACGLFMVGCGGSSDLNSPAGSSAGSNSGTTLSGRVVSESGASLEGVRVVVHERTSNFKATGVSGRDGSFTLQVEPGVYDLGLDKEGDMQTATCFYGPVDAGGEQANFVLKNSGGRPPEKLFGRIWLQPGNPANQRSLTLRPGHGQVTPDKKNPPVTLNTNSDGSFETALASKGETGLDVEVSTASGSLDEFVDIGKLAKPCYVEIATEQSPVVNRLRSNQSELPLAGSVKPSVGLSASLTSAAVPALTKFNLRTARVGLSGTDGALTAFLEGGLLQVDKETTHHFLDIVNNVPREADGDLYNLVNVLYESNIRLADNGSWWWKYAVNLSVNLDTIWNFTDQTNDTYSLYIFNKSGTHKVSYNSDKPAIQAMTYVEAAF